MWDATFMKRTEIPGEDFLQRDSRSRHFVTRADVERDLPVKRLKQ